MGRKTLVTLIDADIGGPVQLEENTRCFIIAVPDVVMNIFLNFTMNLVSYALVATRPCMNYTAVGINRKLYGNNKLKEYCT